MNIGNISGMYPNYALYANSINPSARTTGSDTDLAAVGTLGKTEEHSTDPDKIKKAGKRSSPEECETPTANTKMVLTKATFHLRRHLMSLQSPQAPESAHTRGSMYPMPTKRPRRKTARSSMPPCPYKLLSVLNADAIMYPAALPTP